MSKTAFVDAKQEILDIMKTADPPMKQLLSEDKLCERLDISRGTLREILRSLEAEGFISKRHGEGNFVHNSVLDAKMRINQVQDFHTMITAAGYTSTFIIKKVETVPCRNERILERLKVPQDEPIVRINCLYLADRLPVIYCKLAFPKAVFADKMPDYTASRDITKLFEKHSNYGIEQTMVRMLSANSDAEVSEMLSIIPGQAVLYWEETFYSYTDDILGISNSYFNDNIIHPSMILKNHPSPR